MIIFKYFIIFYTICLNTIITDVVYLKCIKFYLINELSCMLIWIFKNIYIYSMYYVKCIKYIILIQNIMFKKCLVYNKFLYL